MSEIEAVRRYYASRSEREWTRLGDSTEGSIEWSLTTRRISRHLTAPSRVLDIGGGPGRYAIWLARQGHRVVLADLSPDLLAIARERIRAAGVESLVEEVVESDACDLSAWGAASFDAVLSLGPFYHLPDGDRRARAARELIRVVRPNGLVFVAFMPRLALLGRTIAVVDERHHLQDTSWLRALLEDGEFTNDIPGRFDGGYGVRPQEIAPFMESHGIETISVSSAESMIRGLEDAVAEMQTTDPQLYQHVLDLLEEVATEPSILGTASHLLYVGRRR